MVPHHPWAHAPVGEPLWNHALSPRPQALARLQQATLPLIALLGLGGLLALAFLTRQLVGRARLEQTILISDTAAGRLFDRVLLVAIASSVLAVLLESEPSLRVAHASSFRALEIGFTLLFGYEYLLRLVTLARPWHYATSFLGLVDLAAIVPTFLELLLSGSQVYLVLRVLRVLRLLRLFRVLRLGAYLEESELLGRALLASRRKIAAFLLVMVSLVVVIGALMYLIEAGNPGFRSIPVGIYWAVVTITTVGYGDVAPVTDLGRLMASVVMLLGYSIIAVPTGILGAALAGERRGAVAPEATLRGQPSPAQASAEAAALICSACGATGHADDARHCRLCGTRL
ncbi:MAG: potassium channel family protein [Synechococcaceae cyanobacterium]